MPLSYYFTDPAYIFYAITCVLIIPFFLFSVIASLAVNSTFSKYRGISCSAGFPAEVFADDFLKKNGVSGIKFKSIRGSLTDNFNPKTNTISLSETVRGSKSIGAIGVACHEAGHAIQHAKNYFFSSLRLKLVPVVNFASGMLWPIFIIGFLLGFSSPYTDIGRIFIIMGLVVLGLSLLFSLVTLPTEFNASHRAFAYLKGVLTADELRGVKKVLNAAAMTYVASFMITFLQFLRMLAMLFMGSGRSRR